MKTISRLGAMFGRFIIGFGMMLMIPVMAFGAPPVNDNFINAIEITGTSGQIIGTNVDATTEADEPGESPYNDSSVWWTWTAPINGYYTFDTDGSDYSWTKLDVYTGSAVQELTRVALNYGGRETFYAQSGTRYFIAVSAEETGNIILNWRTAHPPVNDNFINAIEITGTSGSVTGTGIDATHETEELQWAFGKSVWWKWIAPATGTCIFDNMGSDPDDPDAILYIYTGSDIQHLNLIRYYKGSWEGALEAQAGTQYFIAVDGHGKGSVKLNWKMKIPPVNDNFADAIILTGSQGKVTGTNIYSTCEATESDCYGSIWWVWTAPTSGEYVFDDSESDFITMLTIYTGSALSNLKTVTTTDNAFSTEAGVKYYISVRKSGAGNMVLSWRIKNPPANDNFSDAIEVTGASGQTTGTNVDATSEESEPGHYKSVWWKWTAPASGYYTFDTDGSDFQTMLDVYTGSKIQDLKKVATNYGGREIFYAQSGTRYSITVSGWQTGNITLNWRPAHPPANDNFADATVLTGSQGKVTGTNTDATCEAAESDCYRSVWWTWTAPATMTYVFDLSESDFTAILTVYTGSALSNLKTVATTDSSFAAEAGIKYYISVKGSEVGNIVLNWRIKISPANDNFADATVLTGSHGKVTGTNTDATCEAAESDCYKSVWWRWTAPTSGNYVFNISESAFATLLKVYTGSAFSNLKTVATAYNDKLSFSAEAGATYHISTDRFGAGDIVLNWECKFGISSVYPSNGVIGKSLPVTISGTGFDANTRISMYPDFENTKAIIGSVNTPDRANDVAVSGSLAYVADDSGLQVIDVSNPKNPKIISSVEMPSSASGLTLSGSLVYVADMEGGLQIVDVSNPKNSRIIGSVDTPGAAAGVAVSGSLAYITDWTFEYTENNEHINNLQIIDISKPEKPEIIGSLEMRGLGSGIAVSGATAYVASGSTAEPDYYGLHLIDVSNPRNPKLISSADMREGR